MKDKIKSYSFWTALSGAVVVLVQALGKCFGFSVNDEVISGIIMAVAGVLVVLGIVTMPKDKKEGKEIDQPTGEDDFVTDTESAIEGDEIEPDHDIGESKNKKTSQSINSNKS